MKTWKRGKLETCRCKCNQNKNKNVKTKWKRGTMGKWKSVKAEDSKVEKCDNRNVEEQKASHLYLS